MEVEFIAVAGPLLGERFPLEERRGADRPRAIGPNPPDGSGCRLGALHRAVREDGRLHLVDHRSSVGIYVNGMRITRHRLERDDQVSICDMVLVYREDPASWAAGK